MSLTKVSYSMINGGIENAYDYGAVNDGGVSDQTTVIQNALNAIAGKNTTLVVDQNVRFNINTISIPTNTYLEYYDNWNETAGSTWRKYLVGNYYNSVQQIRDNGWSFEAGYHPGVHSTNNYNIGANYPAESGELATNSKKRKSFVLSAVKEGGNFPYTQWAFTALGADTSVAAGQSESEEGELRFFHGSPVTKIFYTSQTMNFHPGLYVQGATSGATGLITLDVPGSYIYVDFLSQTGTFIDGEVITEILPTGNPLGYSQGSATVSGTPATQVSLSYDVQIYNANNAYKNNFCKINLLRDTNFTSRTWVNNRPSHSIVSETLYVNASTGNDTNLGTASYPLKTWAGVLKKLPYQINNNITINITGTLSDAIVISNTTTGNATLTVTGGTAPSISVEGCNGNFTIETASAGAVIVRNSQGVRLSLDSSLAGGTAFSFVNSIGTCSGCTISGTPIIALSSSNSRVYSDSWVSGGGSSSGLLAAQAGTIGKNGTQPTGAETANTGGVIR